MLNVDFLQAVDTVVPVRVKLYLQVQPTAWLWHGWNIQLHTASHSWRCQSKSQDGTSSPTCKFWTHENIQGISRLVDITAGGDFLGLCDQKSSYKHVSDFGRLQSYGHFLIPVHALVWTASYGTSWWVMYPAWWLIICISSIFWRPDSRSSQPSGSLCCSRRWHFRKPALSTDQFKLKVISRS